MSHRRAVTSALRRPGFLVAIALVVLVGCAPRTADGSVTIRPVQQEGVWVVRVAPTEVGRAVVVRHSMLRSVRVPRGFVPPPGLCRVWRAELAPARQDPVGACAVLERQAPQGSYLIFG